MIVWCDQRARRNICETKDRSDWDQDLLNRQLAVAKRSERELGVGNAIVEVDAQQRDVVDDGRANSSDEQQNGGREEAESANVVEEFADAHNDTVVMCVVLVGFRWCVRCGREEDKKGRRGTEKNKRHGPEGNGSY